METLTNNKKQKKETHNTKNVPLYPEILDEQLEVVAGGGLAGCQVGRAANILHGGTYCPKHGGK